MATRSRQKWKLDNQGEYARQVGWKYSRNGKLIQHKFRLGDDLKEAKRREQKLLEFWGQVEQDSASQPVVWTSFALEAGETDRKGKVPDRSPSEAPRSPGSLRPDLHRLQRHYPMVSFIAEDEEAYVSGAAANRSMVQGQIGELRADRRIAAADCHQAIQAHTGGEIIGEIDLSRHGGMLHDAMRAYIDGSRRTTSDRHWEGSLTEDARKSVRSKPS